MNVTFVNVVQCASVRKIRIRKICAVCPVRVDIKKSGNNKAAMRIERFAFKIRCTGIVLRRNAVIVLSNSILPVCSPQGSSREAFLIKKRFIILNTDLSR